MFSNTSAFVSDILPTTVPTCNWSTPMILATFAIGRMAIPCLVLRKRRMSSPVSMNNQLQILVTQRLQRRPTTSQNVHHNVFSAMSQHNFSPLNISFGFSRDVHHVHFPFTSFLLRPVPPLQRLHDRVLKRIKRLTAQVLIILHDVAATSPSIISHLRMINGFQPQLRLNNRSNQWTFRNLQQLANSFNAKLGPLKPLTSFRQFDVE